MPDSMLQPIFDAVSPNVNFFEGRLLSAQDLREQQTLERNRRNQLGRAIGPGVIEGLTLRLVAPGSPDTSPRIYVTAGFALNGEGHLLTLNADHEISLGEIDDDVPADGGLFGNCEPPSTSALLTGFGVFVLVASPASGFSEFAPKVELGDEGVAAGCGRRYVLEGLQFRLVELPVDSFADVLAAHSALVGASGAVEQEQRLFRLRNIVAHQFLRPASVARLRGELWGSGGMVFGSPGDALALLHEIELLQSCDVPLGVLVWDEQGVRYVDNWAARRLARFELDPALSSLFPGTVVERLLQFQEHIDALLIALAVPENVALENYFRYLPPLGILPVQGSNSPAGFSEANALASFTLGGVDSLLAGQVAALVQRTGGLETLDLDTTPYLQRFEVEQNEDANSLGQANQRVLVFCTADAGITAGVDGIGETLADAWDVYSGLLSRRAFMPLQIWPWAIEARMVIEATLRAVIDIANRGSVAALAGALDNVRARRAFADLQAIQDRLVAVFQDPAEIPNLGDQLGRDSFASGLDPLVNDLTTGLLGVLDTGTLREVIQAQVDINDYVRNWMPESSGLFEFTLTDTPTGTAFVPGVEAVFEFTFRNGGTEMLQFRLSGEATAPTGDWENVVTLRDLAGDPVSDVTMPFGSELVLEAVVQVPPGANPGEIATLSMTSLVRTTGLQRTDNFSVPVEAAQVVSSVSFETDLINEPVNPDALPTGSISNYGFQLRYLTSSEPSPRTFQIRVEFDTAGFVETDWIVIIAGDLGGAAFEAPSSFVGNVDLEAGVLENLNIGLLPTTDGLDTSFTVSATAVDDTSLTGQHETTFDVGTVLAV